MWGGGRLGLAADVTKRPLPKGSSPIANLLLIWLMHFPCLPFHINLNVELSLYQTLLSLHARGHNLEPRTSELFRTPSIQILLGGLFCLISFNSRLLNQTELPVVLSSILSLNIEKKSQSPRTSPHTGWGAFGSVLFYFDNNKSFIQSLPLFTLC